MQASWVLSVGSQGEFRERKDLLETLYLKTVKTQLGREHCSNLELDMNR